MAWDRTGRFYYRSVWVDGQPRRVYVGGGLLGALAAETDASERAQRAAQDAQRRLERAQDAAVYKAIDGEYKRLRGFVWAVLTATGHYQHKREWRRMDLKAFAKRYREAEERDAAQAAVRAGKLAQGGGAAAQLTGAAKGADVADGDRAALERSAAAALDALLKRINGPKPSRADLDALRGVLALGGRTGGVLTLLDGSPILNTVIDNWTEHAAYRLVMRSDADRMAGELGRDDAPPLERPLIDHIVTCWVRLQLVERDHAANLRGAHNRDSGLYWDRRLTEAQRRYLRALNLLAKLRHLGPGVQVNVANQQVVMNGKE